MKSFVYALVAFLLQLGVVSTSAQAGKDAGRPTPLPATAVPPPAERDNARTSIGNVGVNGSTTPGGAKQALPNKPGSGYIEKGKEEGETSIVDLIRKGGWAMYPLIAMSVLTVMFVLVFFATLRRSAILTAHYMNTADVLLKKRDYLGLLAISSRHSEIVARVVQRTLDFATKNPSASFDVVKDVAESEGSAQAASLQHRVTYLADLGTLSPMVGLFGTVIGIMVSFGTLGSGKLSDDRTVAMGSGVAQALVATAGGLIIGIVAFGFYAWFRNKVQRLISDLEVASAHIVGLMALNYKRREPSRAALEEEF